MCRASGEYPIFPVQGLNNLNQDFVNNNNGYKTAKKQCHKWREIKFNYHTKGPEGHLWDNKKQK